MEAKKRALQEVITLRVSTSYTFSIKKMSGLQSDETIRVYVISLHIATMHSAAILWLTAPKGATPVN